jgi:serine/threonine-protein kinase
MDVIEKLQAALVDRYRIVREIGAGGMATVYLARDVKHDRHVALKLLRPELGAVLGSERFFSEIKVTAHLQHPHLLPLFDSGEAEGLLFYVMPYVEGETLRARLDKEQQLPVEEALRITLAVASALDYAHKQKVVHRDLKPENILMQQGEPVVTDFGIALAVSHAGGARITQTGLSLGTPQYMSPEQATGDREVDARSDIYSLAAVCYEMLTGEPPHSGKTAQAIIARVLTEKPDSTRVMRDTVPPHVDAAVLKALSKLPADRFATAGEFAEALKNPGAFATGALTGAAAGATPGAPPARAPSRRVARALRSTPWAVAAIAAAVAAWALLTRSTQQHAPVTRFAIATPPALRFDAVSSPIAVSPDGSLIVVGGAAAAGIPLQVRALDDPVLKPIPGTEGAGGAFFSPDGNWLGFMTSSKLAKVSLAGGGPITLVTGPVARFADWGPDDVIYFSRGLGSGVWTVSANGGEPRQLTRLDSARGELAHGGPHVLPDGKSIVFTIVSQNAQSQQLATATLDGKVHLLGQPGRFARYLRSGHLLFEAGDGRVLAAPFDLRKRAITGPPVPVLENLAIRANGSSLWAVSPNGTLVSFTGGRLSSLVLVNRMGIAEPLTAESRPFRRPLVSPDGSRIVVEVDESGVPGSVGHAELWMFHRSAGTLSRLTFTEGSTDPVWTRDGKRVAFTMREKQGERHIWWQMADGSAPAEPLYKAPGTQFAYGFSADGRSLLIDELAPGSTGVRVRLVPLDSAKREAASAQTPYVERLSQLSPDGKWVAYTSTESGRTEVYVRPFPGPGGKWQVSTAGGDQVLWNPNGRELFYRDGAKIVSATVQTSPTFSVTARKPLFDDTYLQANTLNWSVMPDGEHFVFVKSVKDDSQLIVAVNWLEDLRRRMGAQK